MATRVTSPSDQKRTAVTLLGVGLAAGRHTTPAIARSARRAALRRRPEMQPAIFIDKMFELRVRGLLSHGRDHGCRRLRASRPPSFTVFLPNLINVILSFRIRR